MPFSLVSSLFVYVMNSITLMRHCSATSFRYRVKGPVAIVPRAMSKSRTRRQTGAANLHAPSEAKHSKKLQCIGKQQANFGKLSLRKNITYASNAVKRDYPARWRRFARAPFNEGGHRSAGPTPGRRDVTPNSEFRKFFLPVSLCRLVPKSQLLD